MADLGAQFHDERPMFEVRVSRDGTVVHRERCETLEQATTIVEEWDGEAGITCEIVDLLHGDRPDDEFVDVARESASRYPDDDEIT